MFGVCQVLCLGHSMIGKGRNGSRTTMEAHLVTAIGT
jgi:hypothetical protein